MKLKKLNSLLSIFVSTWQKQYNQFVLILSLLFCLLSLPLTSFAEISSDKTAKLFIVSDNAELNKSTGVSVFIGNVKVDHGSTHLTSDKLTTYSNQKNQLIKAVAESTSNELAIYTTLTAANKPPLIAMAKVIQYFPQQHYVILQGQAYVKQGTDTISGPHLEYDIAKQILVTKTLNNGTAGRTQIVVQPDGKTTVM